MLENFCQEQPIAYKIMKNTVQKNRLSHAYLIEANSYSKKNELAFSFAKYLLCEKHHTHLEANEYCPVCSKKETENVLDIKIIRPDGLWIKKEQMEALQHEFETKSLMNQNKIYIIENAETLNVSSSNSILKFLEEPEEGIIAILIVDNLYQLLPTIVSRCQIIHLNNDFIDSTQEQPFSSTLSRLQFLSVLDISDKKEKENWEDKIHKIVQFALYLDKNKDATLLHIQKLWFQTFCTKDDMKIALTILLYFYKDVLNLACNRKIDIFEEYEKELQEIQRNNTIRQLCDKINVIRENRNAILYNLNLNLIMDTLILSLKEVKV